MRDPFDVGQRVVLRAPLEWPTKSPVYPAGAPGTVVWVGVHFDRWFVDVRFDNPAPGQRAHVLITAESVRPL